jgi:hypothetical protein
MVKKNGNKDIIQKGLGFQGNPDFWWGFTTLAPWVIRTLGLLF